MLIWDQRYGKEGRGIWIILPGPVVFFSIFLLLIYFLLSQEFSESIGALVAFWCSLIGVLYFLIGNIQLLVEGPRVAQKIKSNGIVNIRFYFGRQIQFPVDNVERIDRYRARPWVNMSTLLDTKKDNYVITLKDGTWFYVAGCLDGVEEFANKLLVQLDKETA